MSRINTNISSLISQRVLGENNFSLTNSLERLSTGLRINRGKDDPAGLIASENLRGEIKALNAAVGNSERADQVVNIAEGGLQEISSLLTELQGLLTSSASTAGQSASEKSANQDQIDSILQTIDRIAGATSFQGTKLLNGSFDYQTQSVAAGITDFKVNGAKFEGSSLAVQAVITQSAQQGGLYLSLGGATLDLGGATSAFVIEIAGSKGSRELQFTSSQTIATIVAAVNTFSDVTGVTASAGTTGVSLRSTEYGSNEFVSVKVVDDGGITGGDGIHNFNSGDTSTINTTVASTYSAASNPLRDEGQDVGGTINGLLATGKGKKLSVNSDFLNVSMNFNTTTATTLASVNAFTITGGGADFQLSSDVNIAGRVSLGISNVAVRNLGTNSLGFLDDLGSGKSYDLTTTDSTGLSSAQKIINEAIDQVSSLRGRLGAFQKNVIGATIRSLGVTIENTSAAESVIRDADFANETASLTRNQILVAASTNVLSLANQRPQAVLQLLG
ncbi:MAG: flagellin [Phycisphaerales bacterium]